LSLLAPLRNVVLYRAGIISQCLTCPLFLSLSLSNFLFPVTVVQIRYTRHATDKPNYQLKQIHPIYLKYKPFNTWKKKLNTFTARADRPQSI